MIAMQRVWAIVLRHLYRIKHDRWFLFSTFYWATIDTIVWGYVGLWMQGKTEANLAAAYLLAVLGWSILTRVSYDVGLCLLEELYSHSLVNLFASPIKLREWMLGAVIFAFIAAGMITLFTSLLIALVYGVNVFAYAHLLAPFLLLLITSGLWLGFFSAAVVGYVGFKAQHIIWMLSWLFLPLSGAYYAVEMMPAWTHPISRLLPMSYIFGGMRSFIKTGQFPAQQFLVATGMNIIYSAVMLIFFVVMFQMSKRKGLARLSE